MGLVHLVVVISALNILRLVEAFSLTSKRCISLHSNKLICIIKVSLNMKLLKALIDLVVLYISDYY